MSRKRAVSSSSSDEEHVLKVNESYAKSYQEKKEKEEISALENKYGDADDISTSDSDPEVVEDETGELLTPEVDAKILQTLAHIRNKNELIYDQSTNFFDKVALNVVPSSSEIKPKITLKEFHRERLLKGDDNDDALERSEEKTVVTHFDEQNKIISEFKKAVELYDDVGEDDSFMRVKPRSEAQRLADEEEYKRFLLESISASGNNANESMREWFNPHETTGDGLKRDTDESFLVDYILKRGWIDKNTAHVDVGDDDEEEVEKMETVENSYNFRFEQPGGCQILTFSRQIDGSLRRASDQASNRKEQRDRRSERKRVEKEKAKEELKRLKNLKKKQIRERLEKIQLIGDVEAKNLDLDLESDFDPEKHDKKMTSMFDDSYYDREDKFEPLEMLDEELGSFKTKNNNIKVIETAVEVVKKSLVQSDGKSKLDRKKLDQLMDEYYKLEYEDLIAGEIPCRFNYQKVVPTTFGLKLEEIIEADDSILNSHSSLKRIAPYRSEQEFIVDQGRLSHKKRIYKFRDRLRERKT